MTRVVNGDTLRISPAVEGKDEVRLVGVDTPEMKEPGYDVQPYGCKPARSPNGSLGDRRSGWSSMSSAPTATIASLLTSMSTGRCSTKRF